jgi:hypothetical protein
MALAPGDTPDRAELITKLKSGLGTFHEIAVARQGNDLDGRDVYTGTHTLRAYADSGTEVRVQFSRSNIANSASAIITISGYLVDVP